MKTNLKVNETKHMKKKLQIFLNIGSQHFPLDLLPSMDLGKEILVHRQGIVGGITSSAEHLEKEVFISASCSSFYD